MNENEEPQELDELSYARGSRMAWGLMLRQCIRELGYEDTEGQKVQWLVEREEIVSQLRECCIMAGDNDWDANDHLGDTIERHLLAHLGR